MKNICQELFALLNMYRLKHLAIIVLLAFLQVSADGQTFEYPRKGFADTASLRSILQGNNRIVVEDDVFGANADVSIKSVLALTNFYVDVQSNQVGKKPKFTYMIAYYTVRYPDVNDITKKDSTSLDTLTVSYDRDSLKLINNSSFKIVGKYHRLEIVVDAVYLITGSGSNLNYVPLTIANLASVPDFVHVCGEIYLQKYIKHASLSMNTVTKQDSIVADGTVRLDWGSMATITPAGYEVEWTYSDSGSNAYDFRNNSTRVFTNNTSFRIPVAQKRGHIIHRVRMVRPDTVNFLTRIYGPWNLADDKGNISPLSSAYKTAIPKSLNDSFNWDLKMSFVEDGKYKQVVTYYDGLLKPKQVQTRFNTNPSQTIVAHTLYDHEGRAVINSLPIPVNGKKFGYINNFLKPAGYSEYLKSMYDAPQDPDSCAKELPISPLDANALSNRYFSGNNPDKTGINAYIPDAEGYPMTRKILAAENSEKILFEGKAGSTLQFGNGRQMEYVYGSPLQAELNKYFGQDIGKSNYYRKMVTTDNHKQDMFSITDDEGKIVASGLIGSPDTNSIALNILNNPNVETFTSNLLPIPYIRDGETWQDKGAYFVEKEANYSFKYKVKCVPFSLCGTTLKLLPKVYYTYEVVDPCGDTVAYDNSSFGSTVPSSAAQLLDSSMRGSLLLRGNHVWKKYSYIKLEDLQASVDAYLDGKYCTTVKTYETFLQAAFPANEFPCETDKQDPCATMRKVMIKEMYPRAKYGKYKYDDTLSKTFVDSDSAMNSIFTKHNGKYRYQDTCLFPGESIIAQMSPQELINAFNDDIADSLLPLHPDYCKLMECDVLNDTYTKKLAAKKTPSLSGNILETIVQDDSIIDSMQLPKPEFKLTVNDERQIDSVAFQKTICGSESSTIEGACININKNRGPGDIVQYSQQIQDEYYKNLVALYSANRDIRITKWLQEKNCDQCSLVRLVDPADTLFFDDQVDDSFFFTGNLDIMADSMKLPGGASYNPFDAADMDNMKNADNSIYCTEVVNNIAGTLASCNVSQATLNRLADTLKNRFCINDHSITSLSYDSLTTIMQSVGITVSDLCNAGLVDLRRITRASHDYVQLGLLHYSPAYYADLTAFLKNNKILDSIKGNAGTMDIELELCPAHPFQRRLAQQLGGTLSLNCTDVLDVQLEISYHDDANAVKLKFIYSADTAAYYLYPSAKSEYNALNLAFNTSTAISNTDSLETRSLFNMHGFDKVSKSYANRNSIMLNFKGTQGAVTKRYAYYLSAFNADFDYNMMKADQEDYLNGIGCGELYPMMKDAITAAEQVNIKYSHPYFEEFIANTINYRNNVNFDYNNYYTASQSCGFTDSFIIKKHLAHFRIKFPTSANITALETYVDTLRNYDTTGIGISDVLAYRLHTSSNYYLLLSVYEANDRNMKHIKEIVWNMLPSGSAMEYLPSLGRDTLAQLFSYDIDQINTTALNNALSGLTISNAPADVYFFRPDSAAHTLAASLLTVRSSSPITNDGLYNRYVDSIYRFVKAQALMTTIFTHAEPSVSPQYYDAHMATWRNYIMGLSTEDHGYNVGQSKANIIQSLNFPGKQLSYKNTRNPYYFNHLYIADQAGTNFNVVKSALEGLNDRSSTDALFIEHHVKESKGIWISGYGNTTFGFYTYVCSDTTQFMINYSFAGSSLTTIFVQLPEYLEYPRESYNLINVSKGFEKDNIGTVILTLKSGNDTIRCTAYTTLNLGATYTIPSAYLSTHGNLETFSNGFENCESRKLQNVTSSAMISYRLYRENLRDSLVGLFRQHIIDNLQEEFTISGIDIKHGVTLYYYDMADNLVMTVPPGGVAKMAVQTEANNNTINNARLGWTGGTTGLQVPNHSKATRYTYNAQNKVRKSTTPDAGQTENFYDPLGRIIISQNAGQGTNCTYFIYDNLSRVIETGLTAKINAWDQNFFLDSSLSLYLSQVKSQARSEVTVTVYDTASYDPAKSTFHQLPVQENLKNRIAGIRYFGGIGQNVNAQADTNYISGLHYSYDVSGNVKTLIHDLRGVDDKMLRFKRVDYEYDLYSGKVLMVSYNRGGADQMYQRYSYDSDNRITDVESSNNGIYWDRDANYEYYPHGPLARMNLGEQRVQGVDYAYTINGWLKAINGVHNDSANDMGRDGATGVVTPKDVFSQRIDYFNGDYKAIGGNDLLKELPQTSKSLYNGNIAAISTSLAPFEDVYAKYHYDPLHRIDRANYDKVVINNSAIPKATVTAMVNNAYNSHYRYDADGNILQLVRYGGVTSTVATAQKMDSMKYHYTGGTNRLKSLSDAVTNVGYNIDIPQTSLDTGANRYGYDNSGNLTRDDIAGLNSIKWYNNGKVKSIVKSDQTQIYFSYDPLGNRLTKEVVTFPATDSTVKFKTIYVRDATGNILAIYEDKKILDVTRFDWNAISNSPWVVNGGYTGPLWGPFTFPVSDVFADALITAFNNNPTDNVAQLAMAVPDLNSYTENAGSLQTLVNALDQAQGLDFVKSMPAITEYTLSGGGMTLTDAKLAEYMQPVMMSNNLDGFQTDVFVALKDNDPGLYNTTVSSIPASGAEKMDFPMNPAMLAAFKGMDPGDRLNLVNTLSFDLAMTYTSTFPFVKDVLVDAYSNSNTHGGFVQEIPGGDIILDAIKQDAGNYVAHRFMEADMELVPLSEVQDQFKGNPVLVSYLSQQAPPPTQAALADIISNNFGDVLTVADNNGLQSVVVEAFQDAITANMDYVDIYIGPWIRYSEVLKSQQQYLSEHHLYGSSRVGLQKYLPDQLQYSYALGQTSGNSFNTLMAPKPWYSSYAHDLFTPAATRDSSVTKTNLDIAGMGIMSHILGNRHYELPNHLGNVQATVLDRTTPIIKPIDTSLIGYKADISTSQDYYPFGMLMPGRYVADTATKCVTINTTILVPHEVRVYPRPVSLIPQRYDGPLSIPVDQLAKAQSFENEQVFLFHYNDADTHPGGVVATSYLSAEGEVEHAITLDGEPSGGVISYLQLHMDTTQLEQEVGFAMELPPGVRAEVRVRQYYNTGEEYYPAIDWTMMETSGPQQLFVPVDKIAIAAGGNTLLEVQYMDAIAVSNPGTTVFMKNYYSYISHYEPQARIVTICDEKDNYRFSFNGMEKDNEVKGIGNSLDFGARIYDSRLGRFLSIDPLAVKFPWQSPYLFAGNDPIRFIDKNGEFQVDEVTANKYKLVTAYIHTQIAGDIKRNALAQKNYMLINPQATKENIENIYRGGSGPIISTYDYPGQQNAAGYTDYNKDGPSTIEINTKVFDHVEGVLANPNSTDKQKQIALMQLNNLIGHEVAGHEIGGYRGVDAKGNDIKVDGSEHVNESGFSDAGYFWESRTNGIAPGMNDEKRALPDGPIKGIKSGNVKFKEGVMEESYNKANETEEGRQRIPSVPTTTK